MDNEDVSALTKLYMLLQKTQECLQNTSSIDKHVSQNAKQTLLDIISELLKRNVSSAELSSGVKQLNLDKETEFLHEKIQVQGNNGYETCSEIKEKANQSVKSHLKSRQKTQQNLSGIYKQEDGFNISGQIESGNSSLQLCSEFVKNAEAHQGMADAVNTPIQTKEGLVTKNGLNKIGVSAPERNLFLTRQLTHRSRTVQDPIQAYWMLSHSPELTPLGRSVLPSQIARQKWRETSRSSKNDQLKRVADQRTSQVLGRKVVKTAIDQPETQTCNYVHGLRVPSSLDDETEGPPMSANMANKIIKKSKVQNPTGPRDRTRKVARSKLSMAEVSTAHKLNGTRTRKEIKRVNNKQSRHQIVVRPTLLIHEQESTESTSSSSHYLQSSTSSWTESEAYSSQEHCKQTDHRNRRRLPVAQESSSDKSSTSSSYLYPVETESEYSGNVSSTKTNRTKRVENQEKRMGRLMRWKNKIGLIFHHHHHHHHHHHNHDSQQSKKHDVMKKEDRASGRKGGVGNNAVVKNEVGHFQALVEGLMRHVGHSKNKKKTKKSYPIKAGIGRIGKKKKKKVDWSKMFRRLKVGNNKRKHVKLK